MHAVSTQLVIAKVVNLVAHLVSNLPSLVAQQVKNLPAMQETPVQFPVGKVPRRRKQLPTQGG